MCVELKGQGGGRDIADLLSPLKGQFKWLTRNLINCRADCAAAAVTESERERDSERILTGAIPLVLGMWAKRNSQ